MDIIWYGFCLIGLFFLGLGDYFKKVIIDLGHDKDVFLAVTYILYIMLFGGNFLLFGDTNITWNVFWEAVPAGFFDFLISLGFLLALKYADSSLVFIAIRIISSFIILAIGAYYFKDNLNIINFSGFILGIMAIYMLSGYEYGKKYSINSKGVLGIAMATIGIIGANSYFKYVVDVVDIPSFMFIKYLVITFLVFIYMTIFHKWTHFNIKNIKSIFPFAIVSTCVYLIYFGYISPQIYSLGPLSISYKILSYSLAVPIILSIIFNKEELTRKKIIAFSLTAISLLFFFF